MSEETQKRRSGQRVVVAILIVLIILMSIVLAGLLYVSHLLGLIQRSTSFPTLGECIVHNIDLGQIFT